MVNLACFCALTVQEANAAISIGTVQTGGCSGTSCISFDITGVDTSGSNTYLLVGVGLNNEDLNEDVVSVVLDPGGAQQTSLSLLTNGAQNIDDDGRVELWSVLNPPSGTFTVRVTLGDFMATNTKAALGGAWNLSGVDQTTPVGTVAPKVKNPLCNF